MLVVKENEQIRLAVKDGNRPDLASISGPEVLRAPVVNVISFCWHQSPNERPAFAGIYYTDYCCNINKQF